MTTPRKLTLQDLMLTRLLVAGAEASLPVATMSKSMDPYLPSGVSATEKRTLLASAIDRLASEAAIERQGHNKLGLTSTGRRHILQQLGLKADARRLNWQALSSVELMVKALDLPKPGATERRRLSSADGLRAAILRDVHALPIKPYPTLTQVRDGLLWYCLAHLPQRPEWGSGCEQRISKPFTVKAVASQLLSNLLDSDRVLEPVPALRQLAARSIGADRTDAGELRAAVIRRALQHRDANDAGTGAHSDDLQGFVSNVVDLARACPSGWFGDNKVFISHVWNEYRKQQVHENIDSFKQKLLQAHRQRLLQLARADLQQAMDPTDVAESEIEYWGARFHFLRLD